MQSDFYEKVTAAPVSRGGVRASAASVGTKVVFRGASLAVIAIALLTSLSSLVPGAPENSGGYMFFARFDQVDNTANDKHVLVSGNGNVFQGNIKSNGDIDGTGNNNTFLGTIRYFDIITPERHGQYDPCR